MPGLALALLISERATVTKVQFYAVVLVGSCIAGYLAFWAYVADPVLGQISSLILLAGSSLFCIVRWRRFRRGRDLRFWLPLAATFFLALFYLGLGFLYGGLDMPLETARVRFSQPMPVDNALPLKFADVLLKERPLSEFMGTLWQTSDRPPLQTGITLLTSPLFGRYSELQYQIAGVILQATVLLGIWFFLDVFRTAPFEKATTVLMVVLSYFMLVHNFYVWPKLLPAGLVLLGYRLLQQIPPAERPFERYAVGALAGAAFAFAMLGHGGTVFALVGIGLVMLVRRKIPVWQVTAAALITGVVLYLPWMGYQHFIDPPGDRLLKLHLGGVKDDSSLSVLGTIRSSYGGLSLAEIAEKKRLNFAFMLWAGPFFNAPEVFRAFRLEGFREGVSMLRTGFFFHLFHTLVLPFLGLAVVPFKLKKKPMLDAESAFEIFLIGILGVGAWGLLLFGYPETLAAVHHGSFVFPLLLMIAPFVVAGSYSRAWSLFLLGLQALLFSLWIPLPQLSPAPIPAALALLENGIQVGFGVLALLGFLGLISALFYPVIAPEQEAAL